MTTQGLETVCDFLDTESHPAAGAWAHARRLHNQHQRCARSTSKSTDFEIFREAAAEWRNATWFKSSVATRVSHPAYLRIIGLGQQAIPWILQELRQQPDYWFPALEALARDKFSPRATSMKELCEAWIKWGEQRDHD
jgi:hypothetical protein